MTMLKILLKSALSLAVLGGAAAAGTYLCYPGLRAQIDREVTEFTGWTEQARQADPVGFASYASRKLESDLEAMRRTRRDLTAEIAELSQEICVQEALRNQANDLAREFRIQFHSAANDGFPVVVRNAAYARDEVKTQVSMILAEADGYEAATAALKDIQKKAESQLETLTVRINTIESELAGLAAQREILQARSLSKAGQKLLAQVDELLQDNDRMIVGNPVRNVRELLAVALEPAGHKRDYDGAVEAFLEKAPEAGGKASVVGQKAAATVESDEPSDKPAVAEQPERVVSLQDPEGLQHRTAKPAGKARRPQPKQEVQQAEPAPPGKLIFQQF
jgi:hypothetical protein